MWDMGCVMWDAKKDFDCLVVWAYSARCQKCSI